MVEEPAIIRRIERIKQEVSIYEFFKWIGATVEHQERPHQIRCPFIGAHPRGDINPSARLFPEDNSIHCFVEARSWDIIDAVRTFYGMGLTMAVGWIEEKMGLDPIVPPKPVVKQPRKKRRKPTPAEINITTLIAKVRAKVPESEREELENVVVYIWEEYEKQCRGKTLDEQVKWELWAKDLVKEVVRNILAVREFVQ